MSTRRVSETPESGTLTYSQVAFPASPSPSPGSAAAREMTAISGRRCLELSQSSSPLGSLLRTLLESPAWCSGHRHLRWKAESLPEIRIRTVTKRYRHNKRLCFSTIFAETSKITNIRSSRLLFRLVPSVPRTKGRECSLWRTPGASDGEGGVMEMRPETTGRYKLRDQVHPKNACMWPTPQAHKNTANATDPAGIVNADGMPWTSGQKPQDRRTGKPVTTVLADAARLWPTPRASDGEKSGPNQRDSKGNYALPGAVCRTLGANLWPTPTATASTGGAALSKWGGAGARQKLTQVIPPEVLNGRLNPAWVECLMGFPPGWTDVD